MNYGVQDYTFKSDFEARLYGAAEGRFFKPDRFSEKSYSQSPYSFSENNPINNIDVNGDSVIVSGSKAYVNQVAGDLKQLQNMGDKVVRKKVIDLITSPETHKIVAPTKPRNRNRVNSAEDEANHKSTGTTTEYDPNATENNAGEKRKPIVGLAHELSHAHDADKGTTNFNTTSKKGGDKLYEVDAVNFENRVRAKTGDKQRTSYSYPIPKKYLKTFKQESE